jgi:hypothetical protein
MPKSADKKLKIRLKKQQKAAKNATRSVPANTTRAEDGEHADLVAQAQRDVTVNGRQLEKKLLHTLPTLVLKLLLAKEGPLTAFKALTPDEQKVVKNDLLVLYATQKGARQRARTEYNSFVYEDSMHYNIRSYRNGKPDIDPLCRQYYTAHRQYTVVNDLCINLGLLEENTYDQTRREKARELKLEIQNNAKSFQVKGFTQVQNARLLKKAIRACEHLAAAWAKKQHPSKDE